MTEPQSSISLLQIGALMGGLLILALVLMGIALIVTRRRKPAPRKPVQDAPARSGRKPAERSPTPARQAGQPPRQRTRPAADPPPPSPPQPAPIEMPVASGSPPPPQTAEVLRVYRDERDDALIIEVDGARYRTLGDIKQAGIDRPFLATLRELARIAKETGDQVTQDASAPQPSAQAVPPSAAEPPAAAPLLATPLPSLEELTGIAPRPQEAEPIGTFFGNMRRMIPGGPSTTELDQPLGFADEIEAILQLKLLSSDEFRGRGIHIRSAPGGGVQIEVGTRVYEAVGDIEDEGIRAFVQSAIQDWERQQG